MSLPRPSVAVRGSILSIALSLSFAAAGLFLSPAAAALFADGSAGGELLRQRDEYKRLMDAARRGNFAGFERGRAALASYPLLPYLDYARLSGQLGSTSGEEVRRFIDAHRDTPLGARLLGRFLAEAGKARRWDDYLAAVTREPRSERLRCYYGRALRARGREGEAWAVASRLWLSGSSVNDACDPLFRVWREAGQLTEALIWERATLAYAAREGGLLRYLVSLAPAASQRPFQALLRSYADPQRTEALTRAMAAPRAAEVLTLGVERYARFQPERALQYWQAMDSARLSSAQRTRVERALAYRGLLERAEPMRAWLDAGLGGWGDDKLIEMRLRWALAESDLAAVHQLFPLLSGDGQAEGLWRYWYAQALAARGDQAGADALLADVAGERSYYGFLSSDRLGRAYSFSDDSLLLASAGEGDPSRNPAMLQAPAREALWRVHELEAIGEHRSAHSEWTRMLRDLSRAEQLEVGRLAHDQQWYRFAIDAANAARASDALDLRFPLAYTEAFRQRAAARGLPVSELMAIARRESAFLPSARSGVGARGLMQLMPSTGIAVAREAGLTLRANDLYDIDHNVDLGSSYYQQLLQRFNDQRPVALAAYNAGPNRVQHWVGKDLPIDAWIETIPYRETRDYVKAVLAYSVVFDYRLGQPARLLSEAEQSARY